MKRFIFLMAVLLVITAGVAVLWVSLCSSEPVGPPIRAIWVTRFDYSSPEDVRAIINNLGRTGFTDVFFQVRGNGTAFFKSNLEPWAYELSGNDVSKLGTDPGWDPLQTAIDTAMPHGLRLHAYINVLPGWKGLKEPPPEAGQLWTAFPHWFMVDSLGNKMLPTSGWYSFLNPVIPEVRDHLRGIVKELCAYDVDGIHLDYIRYPFDYYLVAAQHYPEASESELLRYADFSYDEISQAALYEKYGWEVSNKQVIKFRCDSVTRVVRDIAYVMQVEKPDGCLLSASVKGNPVDGKYHAYQDSGSWTRQRLVDWAVQMNYGTKSFDRYLYAMKKAAGRRGFRRSVVMGLNCKNNTDILLKQLETTEQSGCRGWALFSYTFLFDENHQLTKKGRILLEKTRP